MPAISKLSKEEWNEIKESLIGGASVESMAEKYDVEAGTIHVRAHREQWATPAKVKALALKHNPSNVSERKSMSNLAETLTANGEQGSLKASNLLLSLLQKASPNKLQPLQDVGDVVTSLKGIRLAAGMDRAQNAVQVNLSGFFRPAESDGKILENGS